MKADHKRIKIAYRVTVKDRPDIAPVIGYADEGVKTPWNDGKASAWKTIKSEKAVKYIDLRATQYPAAHLYDYPGAPDLLTVSMIVKVEEQDRKAEEEEKQKVSYVIEHKPDKLEEITGQKPSSYSDKSPAEEKQINEEFVKNLKNHPPKDYEPNTIDLANKKMIRVLFWVFLILILGAASVVYFTEWI